MKKSSLGDPQESHGPTTAHYRKLPPLIVILGPTASGKTELAIRLAKKFHGYIISSDSRQVYRHMDICTAKPTREQLCTVHHEMVDIVEPDEPFTLADYQKQVFDILAKAEMSTIPFLVGGTGLYIDSVVENWNIPKVAPDKKLRRKLEQLPFKVLIKTLKSLDPRSAENIDLNNKRRLIRAIEVAETTGTSFVAQKKSRPLPYRILKLGIALPKDGLNTRIVQRVNAMMRSGLIAETKRLARKYSWNLPAMSGIGYKQIREFLRGEITKKEAAERIAIATRQYAKRQMTWFKRDKKIHWIGSQQEAERLVKKFLTRA